MMYFPFALRSFPCITESLAPEGCAGLVPESSWPPFGFKPWKAQKREWKTEGREKPGYFFPTLPASHSILDEGYVPLLELQRPLERPFELLLGDLGPRTSVLILFFAL